MSEQAVTLERELLDSLIELREATCAAMRVIADCDLAEAMGWSAETRQQRFVDELHAVGIKDGFGVRADALIKRASEVLDSPSGVSREGA